MACPRCGEWAVCIIRPGTRTCLNCGWIRPVEWAQGDMVMDDVIRAFPTCFDEQDQLIEWHPGVNPEEEES